MFLKNAAGLGCINGVIPMREAVVQTLEEIMIEQHQELTPSQRRLADFILQNPYEAALMSSLKMAERLEVSEATVVRFAQNLGFDGYPALREKLQDQMLHVVRSSERVATMVSEPTENPGTLYEVAAQTAHFLNQLLENVSEDDLQEAIASIEGARQLFIFGEGAPGSLVHHAQFWFSRFGLQVKPITQTGRRFYDHIFQAKEDDVALILAFRRPTSEAMALLEVMDECNGKSILVTDLLNSKMHALATQVLTVRRGPMDTFRPLGPVTALIDAMILGLMRKKGEEAVQGLRRLDDLRQRYQVLYK